MQIIFITLPKYLIPFIRFLTSVGYKIYFIRLSGFEGFPEKENNKVAELMQSGIVPLPLENLSEIKGCSEQHFDTFMHGFDKTRQIAPLRYLSYFRKSFDNVNNIERKLQITIHDTIVGWSMGNYGKIKFWADAHPDRKYLVIGFDYIDLFGPELPSNVRLLTIPIASILVSVSEIMRSLFGKIQAFHLFNVGKRKQGQTLKNTKLKENLCRVALVTHQGLNYGNLYQKTLYYSYDPDSEFYSENMLHIDYSGTPCPSKRLHWVFMGDHRESWTRNIYFACVAIGQGLTHIHHIRELLGLLIYSRSFVIYQSYLKKLAEYPHLKIALIDYDNLCPKELLLALESKKIKTVATQERFLGAFSRGYDSIFFNYYLCSSQFVADTLSVSPIHCVDHYIPVGQYRSDELIRAKTASLPEILKKPILDGRKIITVLPFHTPLQWQNSQVDPLTNWTSHRQFLEDMLRLSNDLTNVFIILRYKTTDWLSLPEFADLIQRIHSSDNIVISTEYNKSFYSYDLCAHSDLIIAKFTSLADDCLSVGIPVLFHEYTHNIKGIVTAGFDYSPAKILCFSYEQILDRARIILSGTPNRMTHDYDCLKMKVFGDLSDGRVRERIHEYVERILSLAKIDQ